MPPSDRVQAGQHDHEHRADPEAVEDRAADLNLHLGQQRAEHDAAGEDADRDLRQHVRDQRDHRQHPARRRRKAALEELRHREDARPHVERHQHPAEHEQAPGVQLVVRQRHAARRPGAGQADEVLRADVRREDRGADDDPSEVAAGQEVVVGRIPAPQHRPPGQAQEQPEIQRNHQPVETGHARDVSSLFLRGSVVSINRRRAHSTWSAIVWALGAFALVLGTPARARAETGYDAWLRYAALPDAVRARYTTVPRTVTYWATPSSCGRPATRSFVVSARCWPRPSKPAVLFRAHRQSFSARSIVCGQWCGARRFPRSSGPTASGSARPLRRAGA